MQLGALGGALSRIPSQSLSSPSQTSGCAWPHNASQPLLSTWSVSRLPGSQRVIAQAGSVAPKQAASATCGGAKQLSSQQAQAVGVPSTHDSQAPHTNASRQVR